MTIEHAGSIPAASITARQGETLAGLFYFSGGPLYKIDEDEKKSGSEDSNYYHVNKVKEYVFLAALVTMILGIGAGYIFL